MSQIGAPIFSYFIIKQTNNLKSHLEINIYIVYNYCGRDYIYMKIPTLKTRYKIRDAGICKSYVADNMTIASIAESFNLTISRIRQILYKNREFLKIDRNWEKIKRIHWYRKQIEKCKDSKKDVADLQEQLRKEIEGDVSLVDQSQHSHLTIKIVKADGNYNPLTRKTDRDLREQIPLQDTSSR